MAKVSVIMPVYNTNENYLREAIGSILAQTFTDFEFLIIDNGSREYIKEIIASYKDSRITYYRIETNCGPAGAKNYGIERCNGKYIAFFDSDDIALPERLEKQAAYLEQHPETGCLGTSAEFFGENSKGMHFCDAKKHKDIELHLILGGCVFCQSSVMVRKYVLDTYHIRYRDDCVPAEDYGFYVDLIGKTEFRVLEDVLTYYRFYNANTSNQRKLEQAAKSLFVRHTALTSFAGQLNGKAELVFKLMQNMPFTADELKNLGTAITELADVLAVRGHSKEDVLQILKRDFRKMYYHTRTLCGQWNLLTSPLNKIFNLPLGWRLMCLITRGIL